MTGSQHPAIEGIVPHMDDAEVTQLREELGGLTPQEISDRMKRDGELIGRVIGAARRQYPEEFESTGPGYSTDEVLVMLGLDGNNKESK